MKASTQILIVTAFGLLLPVGASIALLGKFNQDMRALEAKVVEVTEKQTATEEELKGVWNLLIANGSEPVPERKGISVDSLGKPTDVDLDAPTK